MKAQLVHRIWMHYSNLQSNWVLDFNDNTNDSDKNRIMCRLYDNASRNQMCIVWKFTLVIFSIANVQCTVREYTRFGIDHEIVSKCKLRCFFMCRIEICCENWCIVAT